MEIIQIPPPKRGGLIMTLKRSEITFKRFYLTAESQSRQRKLLFFIFRSNLPERPGAFVFTLFPDPLLPFSSCLFSFPLPRTRFFWGCLHEKSDKPNFTNLQKTIHSLISGIDKCIALVNM